MLFTKSWLVLNPRKRGSKIVHPACFPEELAEEFISFFTKKGQWVLDPFLGSGTTLVAAKRLARNGIGMELYPEYVRLSKERLEEVTDQTNTDNYVLAGDSRNIAKVWAKKHLPKPSFCLTSPPYWNQLRERHRRQVSRVRMDLPTTYGSEPSDLGNIDDYDEFIEELGRVFDGVYEVMMKGSYLTVICNNVYKRGRIWPLAFDLFSFLSKRWTPKDERIWCQDNKRLYPFGFFREWISNRCHHYCLVFRKES
jgi:DNA modification methylase